MISYNGSVLKVNNGWVDGEFPTPPTTNLPPMTLKVQYTNTSVPSSCKPRTTDYYTYTETTTSYVYLLNFTQQPPTYWASYEFKLSNSVNRKGNILDANLAGVTSLSQWFGSGSICNQITLRNAVDVTTAEYSFENASSTFPGSGTQPNSIQDIYIDNLVNLESAMNMCQVDDDVAERGGTSLKTCTLKNTTSKLKTCYYMFKNCRNLTSVPLFNTAGVTNVQRMFYGCYKLDPNLVWAWYQQLSTQPNPPQYHANCFKDAGKNVSGGSAVLAQIPASWGGTGEG